MFEIDKYSKKQKKMILHKLHAMDDTRAGAPCRTSIYFCVFFFQISVILLYAIKGKFAFSA